MGISKKGSVFVEASIIFPIIIILLVSIIAYSQKTFDQVARQAEEHNMSREETIIDGVINMGECDYAYRIDFLIGEGQ